jgi:hypothetical protein
MRGIIVLDTCRRAGGRPLRPRLVRAVSLTALLAIMLFAAAAPPASADCTTGGSACLPGTGYVEDRIWNCGSIAANVGCYYASGGNYHWGWGSADADAGPSAWVCIQGGSYFAGCAYGNARACFSASCNDQDALAFPMWVRHSYGSSRTISGHGQW